MKGLGYLVSTLSVLLLGLVAWPGPDEPQWKAAVLVAGMAASVIGMFLRFLSHRKQERKLKHAEKEAER
ncbi:MAG TPA: hypothetical protein VM760_06340 [Sphingomicrobium sp.]|nr:hypothetical protein [Sphingomicrobium sp.]